MTGPHPSMVSRKAALLLNALIVLAYVTIGFLAPNPWIMFGGFLLLAVLIRCATLCWAGAIARREPTLVRGATMSVIALNLVFGLAFAAALLFLIYWLGHFWVTGVKILVPLIAVF